MFEEFGGKTVRRRTLENTFVVFFVSSTTGESEGRLLTLMIKELKF